MGPVTIFSVLSTLKTQDPLSNTRTIWQTICMKQKTGRGMVSIIVPVIVACIALVGALLYATHEPGNPPFTFVRENAEKERMVESSPDAVAPVAEEKGAIAQKMPKPAVNPSPQPEGTWQGGCTSNSNPVFTHAFTDLSMIDALNPIGGIGGGSPGRSYIGVKEGMEAPVYAPVDAVLKTVIYVDRGAGRGEYGLFFEASCEVEILFDHIDRLSEKLGTYAPAIPSSSTKTDDGTHPRVRIRAGELLGYTNGTELARTFDFLVTNYGRKNSFINPKRWEWEQALYGTCPYDYFTASLRAQYSAKLGKPSNTGFIKADSCGNPSHDIAGTASGGWFKGAGTDIHGEYLAIAREYAGVQIAYRKDGMAFASMQDVTQGNPYFDMTDLSPERYPGDIRPGESACYSDNSRWAFIQLASETELLFASGNGACPTDFPEQNADAWLR